MVKKILWLFYCITVFLVLISGCSSLSKSFAKKQYVELINRSFGDEEKSIESTPVMKLTDDSTISEYLLYAALHNPELEAAFSRWKAALEKIPQVQSLPDPRFTYAYYIENLETRAGPQRHKIDFAQAFPWFGKLSLRGDVALQEANIQKQIYESQKRKLFYRVKESYYDYYFLSRSIAITEENLKLLSYFENVARTKYTVGEASHADVIKAQVELGKLEERLLSLRDLKEPIKAKLNAVLNRSSEAELPWPKEIPDEDITVTDEEIIRLIADHNPELKAFEVRADKESKAIDLAKKRFYPDIMLGMSYIVTDTSSMPGTVDSGKDPIMTMLSINLPIWRNSYRASVREAEIRRKSTEKENKNRKNMLISEVKTALYNFRDSGRKIELYRDTLIQKAKQSLNVTQTAFEAGKKDFLSLIDTQRTLLEFELALEKALTDRAKHRAMIEMIIGKDI